MKDLQSYYLLSFILLAAILGIFLESESTGIKILCLTLLFTTCIFASLFHSLKSKISAEKSNEK